MARIMYGYPVFNDELRREIDEGHIALGGCVVTGNDPAQECHDCGLRWGGKAAGRSGASGRPAARGAERR